MNQLRPLCVDYDCVSPLHPRPPTPAVDVCRRRREDDSIRTERWMLGKKSRPIPDPLSNTGDVFYGYEDLSKICGRFIGALFSCPNVPLFLNGSIPGNGSTPCPPFAHFIAYAIHQTRLPKVVVLCKGSFELRVFH
jgi:hypothetical protein